VMADEVGNYPSRTMRNGGRRRRAEHGGRHRSIGEHGLKQLCVIHNLSVARRQGSGTIPGTCSPRPLDNTRSALRSRHNNSHRSPAHRASRSGRPLDAPERQCSVCEPR
jgi:hypothetical protein